MTLTAECEKVLMMVHRFENLSARFGSGVPGYLVRSKAVENGISEDLIDFYLDKLVSDGMIYEVYDGVYSSVPRDARRPI